MVEVEVAVEVEVEVAVEDTPLHQNKHKKLKTNMSCNEFV